MVKTLAFDVYGTLIDTHGVVAALSEMVGDRAASFSQTWRNKQLEYSFRRGLMQNYATFGDCTRQALEYTCQFYHADLNTQQKDQLMAMYRELPAFGDAIIGLQKLKSAGFRLYAFSNGTRDALDILLGNAGLKDYFIDLVSVDALKSFKPSPAVYAYFLRQAGVSTESAWMISSNSFDVIGALSAGMKAAWVKRDPGALFDPWGFDPTLTVVDLEELANEFIQGNS